MKSSRTLSCIIRFHSKKSQVKGQKNPKSYVIFIVLIIFVGIISFSPALSSLLNSITIRNSGYISYISTNVTASSGTANDIQAAVNQVVAAGGVGTVYIPEGTFEFIIDPNNIGPTNSPVGVLIPGGVNVIGQGKDRTILKETSEPPFNSMMFYVDGRNGLKTRISGIKFWGFVNTTEDTNPNGMEILGATDYRVDHCSFVNFPGSGIKLKNNQPPQGVNRGVIDHNDFDNPYKGNDGSDATTEYSKWGYGVSVSGESYWYPNIETLLGNYDGLENIAYIEDNNFNRCRHGIASNGGGFYVARYNNFTYGIPRNMHQIDVHGAPGVGGRGLEAYENIIIGGEYRQDWGGGWHNQGLYPRGGDGVIFNNSLIDLQWGIRITYDPGTLEYAKIHDLYMWNNTMEKQQMPPEAPMNYFYNDKPEEYIEGETYYFYERPGYTPYPYPHPLTLETPP